MNNSLSRKGEVDEVVKPSGSGVVKSASCCEGFLTIRAAIQGTKRNQVGGSTEIQDSPRPGFYLLGSSPHGILDDREL